MPRLIAMSIANAIAIGVVSGLRTMTGPAVVAESASRNLVRLKQTPLKWLASKAAARSSVLLAVGEMIADKLPQTPNRTDAGPLIARGISGAFCGLALAQHGTGLNRRVPKNKLLMSALAGSAGAIAAAYIGIRYRQSAHFNPVIAALLEDAVAVGVGTLAVRSLRS